MGKSKDDWAKALHALNSGEVQDDSQQPEHDEHTEAHPPPDQHGHAEQDGHAEHSDPIHATPASAAPAAPRRAAVPPAPRRAVPVSAPNPSVKPRPVAPPSSRPARPASPAAATPPAPVPVRPAAPPPPPTPIAPAAPALARPSTPEQAMAPYQSPELPDQPPEEPAAEAASIDPAADDQAAEPFDQIANEQVDAEAAAAAEADDWTMAPAAPIDALAHVPADAPPPRRVPFNLQRSIKNLQTIVPVLLTLGVLLPLVGLGRMALPDTMVLADPSLLWLTIAFVTVGVLLLGLGIFNVMLLKKQLEQLAADEQK